MSAECPSCGGPVKRLEVVCELCRSVVSSQPEHIRTIVPRVMDEIEQNQKGEAA